MYISEKTKQAVTYDAIVIGSGISGGWAAMELCKKGLKVLLLERGRDVDHIKDYPTAMLNPWDFKYGFNNTTKDKDEDPIQSQSYSPADKHFYVRDIEHPYIQEKPFNWIRGYQVGGRSLTWGRHCYRLSDLDFEANAKEGIAADWPIRYKDIAEWYSYVETHIGISGKKENLPQLPDGEFLPHWDLNIVEEHLRDSIKKHDPIRVLTNARLANLTKTWDGRGPCQERNLCSRGCPFGGYFSSNSSTIPAAMATGNLTLRPFSIVSGILYDDHQQRATGVSVIDTMSNEQLEFYAKIIFVNASTIATTSILLNSVSSRFPNGFGNDSGQLGHNLMDHTSAAGAYGILYDRFSDKYYKGRRPEGFFIPRFRNLKDGENLSFKRGYNFQGHGERQEWMDRSRFMVDDFGEDFKTKLTTPGPWTIWMQGWGECLPYYTNHVSLSDNEKDKWGLPLLKINFSYEDNEHKMIDDIRQTSLEMLTQAGFKDIDSFKYNKPGGSTIHEMGTARMGNDPKTSVLNKFNQVHAVKNVFVTDGSCMVSSGSQNPSLTYMALTARACDYAVQELKKQNIS
jgi:choline dehydrogenase-like flavoprotein